MSARDVLVLAEIQRDALAEVTLELLAAARGLTAASGGQVVVLVLSPDGAPATPRCWPRPTVLCWSTIRSWPPTRPSRTWRPCRTSIARGEAAGGAGRRPRRSAGTWRRMLSARLQGPAGHRLQRRCGLRPRASVTASFCGGKMTGRSPSQQFAGDPHGAAGQFPSYGRDGKGPGRDRVASPCRSNRAGAVRFEELILPEAGDVDITQQDDPRGGGTRHPAEGQR